MTLPTAPWRAPLEPSPTSALRSTPAARRTSSTGGKVRPDHALRAYGHGGRDTVAAHRVSLPSGSSSFCDWAGKGTHFPP